MRIKKEDGQSMVEFALILPLIFLLLCGIIDFGWIFGNQMLANNICREAARYAAIHYKEDGLTNTISVANNIIDTGLQNSGVTKTPGLDPDIASSDGEKITVIIYGDINILTPLLSTIIGTNTYSFQVECVMRIE